MVCRYLHFVFLLGTLGRGQAQAMLSDSILEINEIIVSASRMEQTRLKVNMPVQIISGKQLYSNASRNLVESLPHEGIWIQKTNHGGGSPFIRGMTGNQVLILKDGIRLNNSIYRYGPNQYLSLQSSFGLQQIDILRGSGAVQYGSDAIGGVIHLISTKPVLANDHLFSGSVFTQWASGRMEKSLNASIAMSKKNYGIIARTAFFDYGDLRGGKFSGAQIPSGYRERNGDIKGRWKTRTGTWDFSYAFAKQLDVPVYHKIVLEGFTINQSDKLSHQLAYVRNKYDFTGSSFFKHIETTLSYQNLYEARRLQKKSSDPIRLEEDGVHVLGVSSQFEVSPFRFARSVLGLDFYTDRVSSEATVRNILPGPALRGLYPDGAKYVNSGVFNYWEVDFKKWHFSWGWRWNIYKLKIDDPDLGAVTIRPSALVWNAAVGRNFGSHRVFINADKTFRAPNVDDAGALGIVDFRFEVPNYDLAPEKGIHLNAGYRWTGSTLNMEHSIYFLRLHDLITRTSLKGDSLQGYPVFVKINSDKAYIYGWESFLNWSPHPKWFIKTMAQYTFGENQSAGEPIRRIPPFFFSNRVLYQPVREWTFYVESIHAGSQKRLSSGDRSDHRMDPLGTPGWNIFNAGLSLQYRVITLRGGLENIFNRDYRVHGSGIQGTGRVLRLNLNLTW